MSRSVAAAGAAVVLAALVVVAFVVGRETAGSGGRPAATPLAGATTPGPVDIGFSQDMAAHHDQAVLMANIAISRGGPAVRGIADTILTTQSQETGQLRGWLALWHQPIADLHPMHWMPGGASMSSMSATGASMPGMASPTELSALYASSGKAFDIRFLQLMIRHHQGGIEMAHYAELHARLAAVRTAATGMRVEQVQDLGQMEPLLQADGAKQLPAP